LKAELLSRDERTGEVRFSWKGGEAFSNVLEYCGQMPIPPYLNRKTESIDKERYQTIYAQIRGSVAAPTAGLHFTKAVMDAIKARGINVETICLHVGAGTFLPVKSSLIAEHPMHREPFSISLDFLQELRFSGKKIIAVGTTSVRSLESLYYIGVDCLENGKPEDVEQWAPYTRDYPYSLDEALDGIIAYLQNNNLNELKIGTRIIIVPGFKFRVVDMMITNFHQPESTLLLLVSAFVGGDWKNIYNYALGHDFRFLSYGDSSLLYKTI
ncbi:MAG: S-adenosylmethionine:tRNA ribosyltransferase-isomerase, partial [Rikenellaceae bacterium]|nr:S-adenosylmethionine:tRNA ribosyltransferase-isomerase [Rikenellaceae bacterium]